MDNWRPKVYGRRYFGIGGDHLDSCPSIQASTDWAGCEIELSVSAFNSAIPATPLPTELRGGAADAYVVSLNAGSGNIDSITGTFDTREFIEDERVENFFTPTVLAVTEGQSRVSATAM